MFGFQSKRARAASTQRLADGGKVHPGLGSGTVAGPEVGVLKAAGFKPGGLIRGPGTGTSDSIQTRKRPGTFIMPADSTAAIGAQTLEELGEEGGLSVDGSASESEESEDSSEAVPVRLSDGEFELPPEQVQAVGEAVLTVLRDATHRAVEDSESPEGGETPGQAFANGGTVFGARGLTGLREVIPKVQAMGYAQSAQPTAPVTPPAGYRNVADLKALIPQMEQMGYPQALADGGVVQDDEQKRVSNQSAMGTQNGTTASSPAQTPTPSTAPTPAPTAPTAAGFMPGTRAVFNESSKAIGDLAKQGRYGAAAGETARAALSYVPALADDVLGGAVRAVGPQVIDAGKQFLGIGDSPATGPALSAPATSAAATNATGQTAAGAAPSAAPVPGKVGAVQPSADASAGPPMAGSSSVVRSGNSYSGSNIAGDVTFRNPDGSMRSSDASLAAVSPSGAPPRLNAAGFVPGAVSAQNMAAADALASRQAQSGFEPAGFVPGGVQAALVRNSTNDWASRNALRNMEVSASSIKNRPEWQSGSSTQAWSSRGNGGAADPEGKVAAYRAAVASDQALQQAQVGLDKAAMDSATTLQREGMQQAGATGRTAMQEQGATARESGRTAIAQGELDMRRTAAGFQTRAAAQQEQLRSVIADPNSTAAARAEAQRALQALNGKGDSWKAVALQGGTDAQGNKTESILGAVNERTGEMKRMDGQQVQQIPAGWKQIGTSNGKPVYQDSQGNRHIAA